MDTYTTCTQQMLKILLFFGYTKIVDIITLAVCLLLLTFNPPGFVYVLPCLGFSCLHSSYAACRCSLETFIYIYF